MKVKGLFKGLLMFRLILVENFDLLLRSRRRILVLRFRPTWSSSHSQCRHNRHRSLSLAIETKVYRALSQSRKTPLGESCHAHFQGQMERNEVLETGFIINLVSIGWVKQRTILSKN